VGFSSAAVSEAGFTELCWPEATIGKMQVRGMSHMEIWSSDSLF